MAVPGLPKPLSSLFGGRSTAFVSEDAAMPFLSRHAISFHNCFVRDAGRVDDLYGTGMLLSSLFQRGVFLMVLGEQIALFHLSHATLLLSKAFLPVNCYRL